MLRVCFPYVCPFCRGEDFEYVDCFVCFGCGQVSLCVCCLGSNVSPSIFVCVVMGSVVLSI